MDHIRNGENKALLEDERRRRSELAAAGDMGELDGMLLPLALAVARLAARTHRVDMAEPC